MFNHITLRIGISLLDRALLHVFLFFYFSYLFQFSFFCLLSFVYLIEGMSIIIPLGITVLSIEQGCHVVGSNCVPKERTSSISTMLYFF